MNINKIILAISLVVSGVHTVKADGFEFLKTINTYLGSYRASRDYSVNTIKTSAKNKQNEFSTAAKTLSDHAKGIAQVVVGNRKAALWNWVGSYLPDARTAVQDAGVGAMTVATGFGLRKAYKRGLTACVKQKRYTLPFGVGLALWGLARTPKN